MPHNRTALRTFVRWMISRDYQEVVRIEADSFENPWTEENFKQCLRRRYCIGMVAEDGDRIVGYVIYELRKTCIYLVNMAIAPAVRRRGVGRKLVERMIGKLPAARRNRIELHVRESNLQAQLFFRACGFKARQVCRDFYEDTDEDAYRMTIRAATLREASERPRIPPQS